MSLAAQDQNQLDNQTALRLKKKLAEESALLRNEVVAALADQAYIPHLATGGKTDQIVRKLNEWNVPIL